METGMTTRREFVKAATFAAAMMQIPFAARAGSDDVVRPPRLKPGDTMGLVNPAGATFVSDDIVQVEETLAALGLKARRGEHVLDRYGHLAGTDEHRAADCNAMFADAGIAALLAVRGGWGCSRILPLIDYSSIRRHPKIVMGYSDITALLVAIFARTGLITFHGPVGTSTWNQFSVDFVKRILFAGEAVTFRNPRSIGDNLAVTKDRIETIVAGTARGRLVGGNLSVLSAMMGSEYLPSWEGTILFLEDEGEQINRVDRMMTQLKLAGVLERIAGCVVGKCTNCTPAEGYGSLTLEEVLHDHLGGLRIPAWYGAMIGHIENKFTLPLGGTVAIDATEGTITMLEPAVA
jgi:muramoyltetrapeptide carboxypeptidase